MNKEKLTQARDLFFNTTLTQKQIADLIGTSQKTVSNYITRNNWKLLKKRQCQMPIVHIQYLNDELLEINRMIAARPEGQRYPTPQEAETRRKICYTLNAMREHRSAGAHAETFMNLMSYTARQNMEDAKVVSQYAYAFMQDEVENAPGPISRGYDLAGNDYSDRPTSLRALEEDEEDEDEDDEEGEEGEEAEEEEVLEAMHVPGAEQPPQEQHRNDDGEEEAMTFEEVVRYYYNKTMAAKSKENEEEEEQDEEQEEEREEQEEEREEEGSEATEQPTKDETPGGPANNNGPGARPIDKGPHLSPPKKIPLHENTQTQTPGSDDTYPIFSCST